VETAGDQNELVRVFPHGAQRTWNGLPINVRFRSIGRRGGPEGLEAYQEIKSVYMPA
jgi:hypothetical protein